MQPSFQHLRCNECSSGAVIERIRELFGVVLIDEIQDMAGYDYDFIAALLSADMPVVMCGDERQSTYRTNAGNKNKGLSLEQYIEKNKLTSLCEIDRATLNGTHRCSKGVIEFANMVYPMFQPNLCVPLQMKPIMESGLFQSRLRKSIASFWIQ